MARKWTRVAWNASSTDEEARAYLQTRLMVLSSSMFWAFVTFIIALSILYWQHPHLEPKWNRVIFAKAAGGLVVLAVIWRGLLARRPLSLQALLRIDTFYAIGTGVIFGIGGYLATDFQPAPYMTLLYVALIVLSRAIVVPSTGKRTLVLSTITFAPFIAAAIAIVATKEFYLPPSALIGGAIVIGTVVTLLAKTGSETTYGLRQHARAATQLGQYKLDRKIGEGGMGAVYVAHHLLLRRPTAIKLLRPERIGADAIDRFEHEVQHMAQLSHPNTVAVFDYGRSPDGVFYYAMEYLDGIDLEKLVQKYGPQPPHRVAAILAQVCGALEEAHARGLVHRDIKPANIILCERGGMPDVAKVVDFGLVKQITADSKTSKIIVGTPAYLAPEAVTDSDRVGPPADIYALGAVGFFLLAGRRAFDGKNALEICVQHVTESPPAFDAPPQLAELILACLSKSPAKRPSAPELARALRALVLPDEWNEDRARVWWSEFRHEPRVFANDPTLTITIDLATRSPRSAHEHTPAN